MPQIARLTFSRGTLVLEGVTRAGIERIFSTPLPAAWEFDPRAGIWRCDAVHYVRVREALQARCLGSVDLVPQPPQVEWPRVALPPLRADQRAAVEAWRRTARGVIVMPTGTGKTEVALAIMAETAVATLVVAPVRDLMHQWHRRLLERLGYDAGVIGDGRHDLRPVSVTTYESACIHMERLGDRFGLIVFDECHHLPGPVRADAARMCAAPRRLGLTATPERGNGTPLDLDALIGPVVHAASIAEARGNTLADYDVVRIPVHLSDAERRRYARLCDEVRRYVFERRQVEPHFTWEQLCRETHADPAARRALQAFYAKQAIEDRAEEKLRVLEDLFRLHAGEPVLVFAGSNAMARDVSLRFLIPCLLHHSKKEERLDYLRGLEAGTYPALVANRVLDEGVDLPAVKVAVVLGGGSGSRQAQQRLGRVLRKSGNARAVLYEVVCAETSEEERSRRRRRNEAYARTRRHQQ
ncbi:MAG: DEAD/DEAH box helicase family protein [Planctomycetales bacterium]